MSDRCANVAGRTAPAGRWSSALSRAVIAVTILVARVLPAQSGALSVRVTDEFRRPISAARVIVEGSSFGAITDSIGEVLFVAVRAGTHTVRAIRPGYQPGSVAVLVRSADTVRTAVSLLVDRQRADSIVFLPASPAMDPGQLRLHVSPAAIVRYRQVRVVASAVRAGGVIPLQLFDDFGLVFLVSRVQPHRTTGMRIAGDVVTQSGQSRGIANFVWHEGRLTGNIHIGPALFVIRPQSGGVHTIVEVDPRRLPRDQPPSEVAVDTVPQLQLLSRPMRGAIPLVGTALRDAPGAEACSATAGLDVGRVPEVRVLVGYTPAARDAQGSTTAIEEAIVFAIDQMQSVLEASGIRVDVELAGTVEVPIVENVNHGAQYWLSLLLSPTTTDPAIRLFRERRQAYHADAMVLVSQEAIGGQSSTPLWPRGAYGDSAYVVVGRLAMNEKMTLAHELGHVLGGTDEIFPPRQTVPPEKNASAYRCKYCFTLDPLGDGWVTLMGRAGADLTLPTAYKEARIPRFSNPDRTWEDRVTGTPIGQPGPADHRATFSFFAATVANYRSTPVWFVAGSAWLPWNERLVANETRDQLRLADVDGDGLADAFRTDAATGTWWWSRNTSSAWAVRNGPDVALTVAIESVRFADFNGDGRQDVFWIANDKWLVSYGGNSPATELNDLAGAPSPALDELTFGDFAGDGRADVFRSDATTGTWQISPDGSGKWETYLPADPSRKIKTRELRLADFSGDSRTDVFASHRTSTGVTWRYVAAGTSTWTDLQKFALADAPLLGDLALGSFDDKPEADILVTTGTRWLLSAAGSGALKEIGKSCHRLANLWVADVDGDGILDVFRTGIRP